MSASTGPREARHKLGDTISYQMGIVKINKGTHVYARTDGYAYPGRSVAAITDVFLGIAYETIDNSAGTAGGQSIKVQKSGEFAMLMANAPQTVVGQPAYGVDDQTVTNVSGTTVIQTGVFTAVIDSATVYIRIDNSVH